jgi:hypothetical protein
MPSPPCAHALAVEFRQPSVHLLIGRLQLLRWRTALPPGHVYYRASRRARVRHRSRCHSTLPRTRPARRNGHSVKVKAKRIEVERGTARLAHVRVDHICVNRQTFGTETVGRVRASGTFSLAGALVARAVRGVRAVGGHRGGAGGRALRGSHRQPSVRRHRKT